MAYRLRGRAGYPADDPFRPTFHPDRLDEPMHVKRPSRIFVCSMGELFDPELELHSWRAAVFRTIETARQHTYQFLTKRPKVAADHFFEDLPIWLGTSIDGTGNTREALAYTADYAAQVRFLSFEPLLRPVSEEIPEGIGWVIVGAQTGPGAIPPKREWVQGIIDMARETGAAVFLKNNLHWPERIQEFPTGRT